jgi:murein DD-endopeptidase MepM/ murein hydrolase activator NlpD
MTAKRLYSFFLLFIFFIMAFFLASPMSVRGSNAAGEVGGSTETSKEFDVYGIDEYSLETMTKSVAAGETLLSILQRFSVPASVINHIIRKSNGIFDLKSIRAGNKYTVFTSNNLDNDLKFMVYHHSRSDFVVFRLKPPFDVFTGKNQISTELAAAGGVITHSLWESVQSAGCDVSLVYELSDLYSRAVDFHRLQRGDRFAVVYERKLAADESLGVKQVAAACLTHKNRDFYIFRYGTENEACYYDEHGNGIKKTFLKAPLKNTAITSKFSPQRLHPVLKYRRPHLGTDFAAPEGTPIMAVGDGHVLESKYHKDLGNHMKIRHNNVYCTEYLHLARFARGIKPGAEVKQGQLIGYVGKTGLATGPHLELRLWKNGKAVDILKENLPASRTLTGRTKEDFLKKIASLKKELDVIKNSTESRIKLTYLKQKDRDITF